MSLETWKKKFYQIEPTKGMTEREAIEHSILKWTGLLSANLKKHRLTLNYRDAEIHEFRKKYNRFYISDSSCALCVKYINPQEFFAKCNSCPLNRVLGGRCDRYQNPYWIWRTNGDPKPMIQALKKSLKALEEK